MNKLYIDTSDSLRTRISLEIGMKKFKVEEKRNNPSDQNALEIIDKLVRKQGLTLKDVDSIQIKTGPGSFTGLRVGVSIANALSFALGISVNEAKLGEVIVPDY